jgi:hypothetical protein
MIISGPIFNSACATEPFGPGRRLSSRASNVHTQKPMADVGSRHTSRGMMIDVLAGRLRSLVSIGGPERWWTSGCVTG